MDERIEINRINWNERTPIHVTAAGYNVAGFKRGELRLTDTEISEVGDVNGKSLLHLQCHFGMDTMSWARLGARATGVDLSDEAIRVAQELNAELDLGTRFIRANVYDLPEVLDEQFDVVFTGRGALCWLPDMAAWAKVVARHLRPGGTFYVLDSHPAGHMYEPIPSADGELDVRPIYSYFHDAEGWFDEGDRPSYTGDATISTPVYEWQHSLSDIINAVIGAGMTIEYVHEFPFAFWGMYPNMVETGREQWQIERYRGNIPFTFSLRATK